MSSSTPQNTVSSSPSAYLAPFEVGNAQVPLCVDFMSEQTEDRLHTGYKGEDEMSEPMIEAADTKPADKGTEPADAVKVTVQADKVTEPADKVT